MDPRNVEQNPDGRPPARPYMPTPEQYAASLSAQEVGTGAPPLPTRRPKRPRRSFWFRFWRAFIVFVLIILVVAVGYGLYIASHVAKISTNPLDLSPLAGDATGRTNVLVLGHGDPGHAGEKLSDTIMVISLDSTTKRVAQVSVPRDLRVRIPGRGSGKVNTANALGGVALAEQTIGEALGIPVHYYVKTDFTGLKQLVDAVGGIDVDVKDRLRDPEYPCEDNPGRSCGLDIQPGLQHMDGARALQYVRCRKGTCGNDFGRAERQQEVINLIQDKVARIDVVLNPAQLTPVIEAVRTGITTDMSAFQMIQFGRAWREAQKNQPVSLVLSTSQGGYLMGSGTSDLVPIGGDFEAIQQRVNNIFSARP